MKKLISIALGVVVIILIISSPFLVKTDKATTNETKVILSVWQIDSFEGGTGSRTTFIKEAATAFCKNHAGVYILVKTITAESASENLLNGVVPDVISYGACGLELGGLAKELNGDSWGGSVNGKTYAAAFLRGGYFVIKKGGGSKEIILSKGKYNQPMVACLFSSVRGEKYVEKEPQEAFSYFVRNKSVTMIGTQRDIVRLKNYGADFSAVPIGEYSDLIQYLSLTAKNSENASYGERFINYLLSSEVQNKITKLKMLAVNAQLNYADYEELNALQKTKINYVLSPFSSINSINELKNSAKLALLEGGDGNSVINLLKQL